MQKQFDLAPTEWATLRRLLGDALDRPAAERASWVEQLDAEFEAFKPRLRALLEHAAHATGALPLDTLPKIETAQFLDGRRPGEQGPRAGAKVGPYVLIRRLGEGGMGEVWLAERTDMLQRRQVALKLPRLVTGRAEFGERLAREREILAALEHPNIARLYDAGVTADGQPYLALEYVEGERIDAYCKRKALDVPARLRLFLQVARAVAHAHSRLVVHRDLKPANILVTEAGEVRLLDFGIAKLLEDGRAQETELTQLAGRALTPDYAAPEQILGQPIGTAADVYALGVVLFELLSGSRPYQLKRDSRAALEEAIVQADVPRPSSLVTDAKLRKQLRGDLDTIVLKALKKIPGERYGTVEALADDIERYLNQRPVQAQPDSRWYELRKFVARNRVIVGAAATTAFAIVIGAGAAVWQARIAIRERDRAEEVRSLVTSIFRDADIYQSDKQRVSALALLQSAQQRIDRDIAGRPALQLELQTLVGIAMNNVHEPKAAEEVMRTAVADGVKALGATHPLVLRAREVHVLTLRYMVSPKEVRQAADELIPVLRSAGDEFAPQLVRTLETRVFADNALGEHAAAEADSREMLALASARLGPDHDMTQDATWALIDSLQLQKKVNEALVLARPAFGRLLEKHKGNPRAPAVIEARDKYGRVLVQAGQTEEGLAMLQQAVDDASVAFGPTALAVAYFAFNLAYWQAESGRVKPALETIGRSLAAAAKSPGTDSMAYARALALRGDLLLEASQLHEARDVLADAAARFARLQGPEGARTRRTRLNQILAEGLGGELGRARHDLDAQSASLANVKNDVIAHALLVRGVLSRLNGDAQAALAAHEQAWRLLNDDEAAKAQRTQIQAELGADYLALGRSERAVAELQEALARSVKERASANPSRAQIQLALGRAQLEQARPEGARTHLIEAETFWRDFSPNHRRAGEAAFWLARCEEALGQDADARQLYVRAARTLGESSDVGDAKLVQFARRK